MGKEVSCPKEIWLRGPARGESKSDHEDLMGLKGARLSQVDAVHFVFYGYRDGCWHFCLLALRSYPGDAVRFVKLTEVEMTSETCPLVTFEGLPKWDLPVSGPMN